MENFAHEYQFNFLTNLKFVFVLMNICNYNSRISIIGCFEEFLNYFSKFEILKLYLFNKVNHSLFNFVESFLKVIEIESNIRISFISSPHLSNVTNYF